MRDRLPGLLLTGGLGLVAWAVSRLVPGLGAMVGALLLGIVTGNVVSLPVRTRPGVVFAAKTLLAIAIALLGFGIEVAAIVALGAVALPSLLVGTAVVLGLAVPLGRRLGVAVPLALLVGTGQAICGTAAIAAARPVLGVDEKDTGLAIGAVNLLGTIGLVVLPPLGLMLTPDATALVLGGTLQSVGHAVGAGFAVSEDVGATTTLIKLGRVAMLPLVLVVLAASRRNEADGGGRLPPEVYGFVVAAALAAMGWVPARLLQGIGVLTDVLLIVSMAGIGIGIRLTDLRTSGTRVVILGALLFVVQIMLMVAVGAVAM